MHASLSRVPSSRTHQIVNVIVLEKQWENVICFPFNFFLLLISIYEQHNRSKHIHTLRAPLKSRVNLAQITAFNMHVEWGKGKLRLQKHVCIISMPFLIASIEQDEINCDIFL